ncbi:MAG: hypothetical protein P1P67_08720 [Treponema phagedenis]|uniref:hypothetical protein n=1 Tax=Treponema phagedenis TaxID=162 RepID=UPI0031341287
MNGKDLIASVQADAFTQELLQFIINTGVGTYSKTDIYDYIVYLANKHSNNIFFDRNSNFDNAVLFKVSETKIKNMRQNIALKFKGEERTNVYYDFFSKLQSKSIKVQIPNNSDEYILFIEDPFARMTLENMLKKNTGTTADYSFNREIVKVKRKAFISALLEKTVGNDDKKFIGELKHETRWENIKDFSKGAAESIIKNCLTPDMFIALINVALKFF